ncbi:Polyribonucleotide nucleotidyltransferase [Bienertia sinuspersici]
MSVRWLLEKGVRWRVGNWESIKIWKDRWLNEGSGKFISPNIVFEQDAKVALLIDKDRGCWRDDVLEGIFLPLDVKRIRDTIILSRWPADIRCWEGSKDRVFRVRDAYSLAIMEDQPSSSNGINPIWSRSASWCTNEVGNFREWFAVNGQALSREGLEVFSMVWTPRVEVLVWGIIRRDKEGKVVYVRDKYLADDWTPELAEARAALEVVTAAKEEGWSMVTIEGDAQVIVQALQYKLTRRSQVQICVEDILAFRPCFDNITFSFCFRECNSAAHRLVKWEISQYCDEVWHDGCQMWISDIVIFDMLSY